MGSSHDLFFGSHNLLEWLTEFRKVTRLLVYYSETAIWKRHIGKVHGSVEFPWPLWVPLLPAPPCVHQLGSSLNSVVHELWCKLHYVGLIDYIIGLSDQFNLQHLSPHRKSESGAESFNPVMIGWFSWQPASILCLSRSFPKIASLTWSQVWMKGIWDWITKTLLSLLWHRGSFRNQEQKLNILTKGIPISLIT